MLGIQSRLTRAFFALLSLPATAMGFALSVQISALSWILSTQYNLDIHEVGFVWAAGPAAGIIGQVVIGIISDKAWFWGGRRRPFILIGGALAALSLLALPSLGKISDLFGISNIIITAVMVALTLDLAINISFNPTRSIIADVTPEGIKRTKGYTWMQTVSGMFGVLAYVIGATWGNFFLIYFGAGLVLLFSVIPPLFIQEPPNLDEAMPDPDIKAKPAAKTRFKELYKIYAAHGFCWLGVQTMFVYIYAYIQHAMVPMSNEATGQVIAISFAVLNTVGFILPATVLEPLSSKIGRVKTHTMAMVVMSIGYLMIIFFGFTPMMLYILMGVVGVGWAATVSLPFAIMTEKVNKNKMGFFMGIFNLSVVIPQLIVSFGFGLLIEFYENKNLIFIICAVSLGVSALLWSLVYEGTVQKKLDKVETINPGH